MPFCLEATLDTSNGYMHGYMHNFFGRAATRMFCCQVKCDTKINEGPEVYAHPLGLWGGCRIFV